MSTHPMSEELRELPPSFEMCDGPNASRVIIAASDELDRLHAREADLVAALREWIDAEHEAHSEDLDMMTGQGRDEMERRASRLDAARTRASAALDSTGGAR